MSTDDIILLAKVGGIVIAALGAIAIGFVIYSFGKELFYSKKNKAILKDGVDAFAVVESLKQTGLYINSQPEVLLDLLVKKENGQQFSVKKLRAAIPLIYVSSFHPGKTIKVKYMEGDESKVAIEDAVYLF